jgi:hypothetical protein
MATLPPLSLRFPYAGIPHPARPPASSPAPPGGRGQSWRYPGRAASGRANPRAGLFSRFSPYAGPWVISPRGLGRRGGMRLSPVSGCNIPPPLPAFSSSSPPYPGPWGHLHGGRGRRGGMRLSPVSPLSICRHPPPLPCLSALNTPTSPIPRRPFLQVLPHTLDRGRYLHRGGADGGACASLLSLVAICRHLRDLASIWRPCPPCLWLQYTPTPPGLRPPPPPPGGAGAVVAIPGENRIRESEPPPGLFFKFPPIPWTVGTSPRGWGRRGGGMRFSPVSGCNMPASPTPPGLFFKFPPIPWTVGTSPRGEGQTGGACASLLSLVAIYPHPARPLASSPAPRGGSRGET